MTACRKAEIHPLLAEVLVKMHTSQKDIDEEIKTMRSNMLAMAKVMEQTAGISAAMYASMTAIAEKNGIDFAQMFQTEQTGG